MPRDPYVTLTCVECGKLRSYQDEFSEFIQVTNLPKFCDQCAAPYLVSHMEYVVPLSGKEVF